jgi:hypothetical protein
VAPGRANVLLIASAIVALMGVGIVAKRMQEGMNGRALGWMSEQWLVQHRASQLP